VVRYYLDERTLERRYAMSYERDDGGRAEAGYKGSADDCGVRAVAIATGIPYADVYRGLFDTQREFGAGRSKKARKAAKSPSPRSGVFREPVQRYMEGVGWEWVPTMKIGSGCTVHLRADELPAGKIVAMVSKHFCAVVDGVVHDTHDPTRDGTRCVYGYFTKATS
jgi:hypothetical protein